MRKNMRRSQLIAPYGVGSIVNFPMDESLMTCGLDAWPFALRDCPPDFKVDEERLQQRLGTNHFRLPPDYRIPGFGVKHADLKIPFVRFPRWHYCRRCGDMRQLGLFSELPRCRGTKFSEGQSCSDTPEKKRQRLQAVRFIAVCPKHAHIQDFPFMDWVHRKQPATADCRLRYRTSGTTAGLAGITIRCSCGESQNMAGAFGENALQSSGVDVTCAGRRPWLGEADSPNGTCGQVLRVVQRGASNVYFDHTASSIYLPLWAEDSKRPVVEALDDPSVWGPLSSGLVDGAISLDRCQLLCGLRGIPLSDAEELREAAQRKMDGIVEPVGPPVTQGNPYEEEERYRQAEYEALRTGRGGIQTDLYVTVHEMAAGRYDDPIQGFFSKIGLVHKLRETRALLGFSRYIPDDERSPAEKMNELRLAPSLRWLPASVTRGEGIFFELDDVKLTQWLNIQDVGDRVRHLEDNYNAPSGRQPIHGRTVVAKFVFLHTLAHLLINQLSFECGYGSSSLRERIYCNAEFPEQPMSGFLIYTAAGDSEGTMGGLVRQGEPGRLEGMLRRALRHAAWCSYDPVCVESDGQGPDSCNLAACHGCAILPETSCEEGNRLLDRVLVAGLPTRSELGYFGEFVEQMLIE